MSAERILALAQVLRAARTQAATTQDELLRTLEACSEVDQRAKVCHLVDPARRIWRLCWYSGHVDVQEVPTLDVPAGAPSPPSRSSRELLDF